jgi:hypothetical protein
MRRKSFHPKTERFLGFLLAHHHRHRSLVTKKASTQVDNNRIIPILNFELGDRRRSGYHTGAVHQDIIPASSFFLSSTS